MQPTDNKGVSFVVCCHNSEEVIEKPIKAILEQKTTGSYELIVVDNNCSDNTIDIIKKIYKESHSDIPLTIVAETRPGVSWARKKGYEVTRFDYISFIDDDNIISSSWTNGVIEIFGMHQNIGILGSSNEPLFLDTEQPEWFEAVKGAYACDSQGKNLEDITLKRKFVYGAGMCIRKEILAAVYALPLPFYLPGRKGNTLFSGDDSELVMRAILLGWKMYCTDALKLKHIMTKERMRWRYFCKMLEGHSRSSIILQIYSRVIQGDNPLSRKEIIGSLVGSWRYYAKTYKFRHINSPNHVSSQKYTKLKGRTLGMIDNFSDYNKNVRDIMRTFINYDVAGNKNPHGK